MSSLPFPRAVLDQHLVVLGKTRSGKSSTLRVPVEYLLAKKEPVGIIDPKGDWWGIKSSADGKHPGYEVVIFGGAHADVPITGHSGKAVAELVASGNRPYLIDLGGWMVGDRTRFFIDFASTLFIHTRGHRWLVIDECHNFAPQGKVGDPDTGKMLHWANRLASEGAGKGLILMSASQRPQKVHKDYLTSHETLIAKRVIHPLDRGAVKDWIDGCGDPALGKQVLDSLAGLQRKDGWIWSPEIGFGPKLLEFPMFETYDSFKPQTGNVHKLKGWASVDLEEVKVKLAKAVEEAKANDPKLLRDEIGRLKGEVGRLQRQMTEAAAAKRGDAPDPAALEAAEKRGFERAQKEIGKTASLSMSEVMNASFGEMERQLRAAMGEAKQRVGDAVNALAPTFKNMAFQPSPATRAIAPPAGVRPKSSVPPKSPAQLKPVASNGDTELTGPEQRILNSLATWRSMGHGEPSNAQVAWLANYSPTSTSYTNPRGALKSKGLVDYPAGDRLMLTPAGEACSRATAISGSLLDHVLAQLPGPENRILAAAAAKFPDGGTNAEIAEAANYSPSSTSYTNPRGALRSKELITYPTRDAVRAADWLFERAA